jgi:hypothetical protein
MVRTNDGRTKGGMEGEGSETRKMIVGGVEAEGGEVQGGAAKASCLRVADRGREDARSHTM